MLVQVWGGKSAQDGEGWREGVSRFLRAAASQPQAMLPLQVPNPQNQTFFFFLCKVGDCRRTFGCEPRSWLSGRSSKNWRLAIPDGRSQDRAKVRMMLEYRKSNLTSHFREKEVSVLWTITQPCIEDYRITLCPQHHQVGISRWEITVSPKESDKACWIGNFSRPNLKNDDDFLVEIQLTNLNDFDFHFEDCKVFSYNTWLNLNI